jgi:hypothetical protein
MDGAGAWLQVSGRNHSRAWLKWRRLSKQFAETESILKISNTKSSLLSFLNRLVGHKGEGGACKSRKNALDSRQRNRSGEIPAKIQGCCQ